MSPRPSIRPAGHAVRAAGHSGRTAGYGYRMALDRLLGRRLGAAGASAVPLLVPFGVLGALVAVEWAPLRDADAAVSEALHAYAVAHPGWVDGLLVISLVFSPMSLRVAVLVLVIWLVRRRHATGPAWWAGATMAAGGILGALLKLLVGRDRPDLLDPVAQAAGYSFPSGHALNSALAAAILLRVLLPAVRDRPGRRAALWAAAVGMPLLTGFSRVGLGVHYTSDVVAGWLFGVAVAAVTTAVAGRRRGAAERPLPAAGTGAAPPVASRP